MHHFCTTHLSPLFSVSVIYTLDPKNTSRSGRGRASQGLAYASIFLKVFPIEKIVPHVAHEGLKEI